MRGRAVTPVCVCGAPLPDIRRWCYACARPNSAHHELPVPHEWDDGAWHFTLGPGRFSAKLRKNSSTEADWAELGSAVGLYVRGAARDAIPQSVYDDPEAEHVWTWTKAEQ